MDKMDMNIRHLRVLWQVLEDQTFSKAAKSLGLTQPNVSQIIGRLEAQLRGRLFERVGHALHPTPLCRDFQSYAESVLEISQQFEDRMNQGKSSPAGLVRYAMPESCQWTPHYRAMMGTIVEVPDIRFQISILPNETITRGLLEAEHDFGFVVGERIAPELRFEKFSDETYSLIARNKRLLEPFSDPDRNRPLRLVTYPGWEMFFTVWARAHGLLGKFKTRMSEQAVHIGTLAGAIHAIEEGAGAGVIPVHCVASELKENQVTEWPAKGTRASMPVYITRRREEKLPHRVEVVLDLLRSSKAADRK